MDSDPIGFVITKSATGAVDAEPVFYDEESGATVGDGDVEVSSLTGEIVSSFGAP